MKGKQMTVLQKMIVVLAVGFAMGLSVNVAQANCGSCGAHKEHKHDHGEKKEGCVKCAHKKVCQGEGCTDEACKAECTCPAKKEKKDKAA